MTTPTEKILHVKGRLVINPTNLAAAFPYGGTVLGTIQAFRLRKIPRADLLTEEANGGELVDLMHLGFDVEATAIMRNWDTDLLAEQFPNSAAPGVSGVVRQLHHPGTILVEGQWLSDFSSVLLWAPFDPSHPGLLVYNAVPFYRGEIALRLSAFEDLSLEDVRWLCLRDGSDRTYRLASFSDLVAVFP